MSEHPDPRDPSVTVVASVSGGKDSTALSLWLTEQGIEHRRVHADTGWEHPSTEHYVREVLPKHIGSIDIVAGRDGGLVQLVKRKGMFPSRKRRFCTQELKVRPLVAYQRQVTGPISAVGLRAQESMARAVLDEWEEGYDISRGIWTWRPLLRWTFEDVVAIHKRHGVPPNPLYLAGASRVGCWPCIMVRKAELRFIADSDPGRIDTIRELEADTQARAQARYAAKGETFESKGYAPPTFFHPRERGSNIPIDDAVAWSRTSHGGRQVEMFHEEAQDGCMRWGLCDSTGDIDAPEPDEEAAE